MGGLVQTVAGQSKPEEPLRSRMPQRFLHLSSIGLHHTFLR